MKYKILYAVCCALLMGLLGGCQLAREDAGANAIQDRLIGVFVTTDYIDLFDAEGYLNENLKGFQNGNVIVDGDTRRYEGRLYGTQPAWQTRTGI